MEIGNSEMVFVTKAEMARCLRVSLPTLTNWISKWPDFPIASRGKNGSSYKFAPEEVRQFLLEKREEEARENEERDQQLQQAQLAFDDFLPRTDEFESNKLKPKEQIDLWRVREMKRKEAERCRNLLPADEMLDTLRDVFARLGQESRVFIRKLGRSQNWPDAICARFEAEYEDMQRTIVANFVSNLTPEETSLSHGPEGYQ